MIDLQVNGAFGIDLFRADAPQLDALAKRLGKAGLTGFLPTLITAPTSDLEPALQRVGGWVARFGKTPGARPLGLHLEGPFLNPESAGVHPAMEMKPASTETLEHWWTLSQGTLRLLTVAPEIHSIAELKLLTRWARKRDVRLSIGHSRATFAQAQQAFNLGFSGVTHAWNAGTFHHREPGVLGAAVGRPGVHVMVIVDGVHVHAAAVEWLLRAHSSVIFVSDCAPSAGMKNEEESTFGPIRVRQVDGGARVIQPNGQVGAIGGSGMLLPAAVRTFQKESAYARGLPVARWKAWTERNAQKWLGLRGHS